ncbi:MAG: DUF362 domain-containing protein [Anaerolineaceae bacterium]
MTAKVYYGSPRQARLEASESLPAKLDLILDALHLRDRVKGESVCLKLHVGNHLGYSTVHPVFVRKVVNAIKDGGGKPFIVDVDWDVAGCESRGYTAEVLGCPVYPSAGIGEKYWYPHEWEYKNLKTWKVAGLVEDASFLVNFAHVKGHPATSVGAAFKNIGLGCMIGETRSQMHDTNHFDRYWFKELCPDKSVMAQIVDSCPFGAIVTDKYDAEELHVHFEPCNQCGRCLKVAPPGSLLIQPVNFHSFMEAIAISTAITLSTFAPEKRTHLALATHMTPMCDCFGFTTMPVTRDAGIFGSDDIVALETAVLDATARNPLIPENLPTCMEVQTDAGHPFSQMHGKYKDPYVVARYGEMLGLGSHDYELLDVLPVEDISPQAKGYYISAR